MERLANFQRGSIVIDSAMLARLHDGGSKITFAPGTNFEEGSKTRRNSEDPGYFNIRMVGKIPRNSLPNSINEVPTATDMDGSYADAQSHSQQDHSGLLPHIASGTHVHTVLTKMKQCPAPLGLAIPTLCAYVADKKPLLSAAKAAGKHANEATSPTRCRKRTTTRFPVRFPPLQKSANQLVGASQLASDRRDKYVRQNLSLASKHCGHYGSTDSLNLYLRQSTFSSAVDDVEVFPPYRHVPNLLESLGKSRTLLQDNERIQMLHARCKTDDYTEERLAAYKPPSEHDLKQDFITS